MFLIIETATSRALIALCDQHKVLAKKELQLALASSSDLEPALQQLLQNAHILPKDLEFVAVGQGPGSYTGLRVGAASAKAISIACNIPLVGLSTLRGFVPPADFLGAYLAAIDAKIGGVYVLAAEKTKDGITFFGEEKLMPWLEFVEALKLCPFIATPAWEPIAKRLEASVKPQVFETSPSAEQLFLESKEKFANKEYTLDGTLPLLYLRLTQAEMEKLPNKGQFQ